MHITYSVSQQLADEGRVSSDMITPENEEMDKMTTPDKRVHLRLCVRQAGGHFIPYPCWGNRKSYFLFLVYNINGKYNLRR